MFTKKILGLFTAIMLYTSAYGGHEIGGMIITYESVAHVNNNSLQYVLTVYNLVDNFGLPSPSSVTVNQASTCYSNTTHSLPRVSVGTNGILQLIGSDYCSTNSTIQTSTGLAIYRDTITLPGVCATFKFYISSFSRYGSMINIANGFGSNYFEVKLNNLAGPNSSPTVPVLDLIQAACTGKTLSLYNFSEADGDSLHFGPGFPQMTATTNHAFASGYNVTNQIGTTLGFTVNSQNGNLQTQAQTPGQFLITINYAEYRKHPTSQQTVFVGGGQFNLVLFVSNSCNSAPFDMVYETKPNADSLGCRDSTIRFATSRKIASASLTSSGSEFSVQSVKSGSLNVIAAQVLNDSIIELAFSQPFNASDTLEIRAKTGSDGNIVLSRCGKELIADDDTLWFYSPNNLTASAQFTLSRNILSVNFNSLGSTGSSLQWDFGDGSATSSQANPTHTYSSPGLYTVQLIAFNTCGPNDTLIQALQVCDSLSGIFTTLINGDTLFVDAGSSSGVSQYYWDFGDGNSGTGITNNHVYAQGGAYVVTLTMVNLCGDSLIQTDTVNLCEDALANWTYTIISTTSSGMLVDFDGTASLRATTYQWDFGDGATNNSTLTPQHLYTTPSLTYLVTLTVFNDCNKPDVRSFRLNQIGMSEFQGLQAVQLYPNPAKGMVHLKWPIQTALSTIEVISIDGEVISTQNIEANTVGEISINMEHIPAGVYFLKLNAGNQTKVEKLIIE